MAKGDDAGNGPVDLATNRSRWATRKLTVKSSSLKRISLMDKLHKRTGSTEKKRNSDGSQSVADGHVQSDSAPAAEEADAKSTTSGAESGGRTVYFNLPLPDEMKDDEGNPIRTYSRNKIRTAKYTPLSFIPKNLWNQFHNIANIFFLFMVILVIFPIFGGVNPGLNAVPLIFIIAVTAIKDAIEDYRRTILDNELNNAPVHRLIGWNNVNVAEDNVSLWRRIKKATSKYLGALWRATQGLWNKDVKNKNALERSSVPRLSVETKATRRESMISPRTDRTSYVSAYEEIQMTPVASPLPPQVTQKDLLDVSERPASGHSFNPDEPETLARVKGDLINYDLPPTGRARFHKDHWKNLQVGDFVRLYNDDELPADVIVLATSDSDGACYVETKNLDGETNLKVRQALRCGRTLKHAKDCERAEFLIESEPPQPNLYKYNGAIKWDQMLPNGPTEMSEPISIDNVLLRGCNLRNTDWVLGVVLFTGHDTKIMMNAGITPSKRARIARELNFNVICNFGILGALCLLSALVNGVSWSKSDASTSWFDYGAIGGTAAMTGFITFWATLIVFQNLVPISLYITLEIIRTLQAIFIYSDVEMYYEEIDYPCVPKSWNISDDLGQIEYIFSDKTGTLTQNVMEFKKATINGQPYGEAYTEAQAGMQKRLGIDVVKEAARAREQIAAGKIHALDGLRKIHDNPYLHAEDLTFIAPDFVDDLRGESGEEQKQANAHFMLALALCHTVIADRVPGDPPKIEFKAQSPDEAALVSTARDMGFTVLGQTSDGIRLNVMGQERQYPVLNTIEFNSSRKRMSAIVKMPDGRIILFCKGADSIIYSRLKRGEQAELRKTTAEHLEMFAREGLRTLCIAQRVLSEHEYLEWRKEHDKAATALQDREEKLEEVADKIEQELTLLGGTAIEDRLQDGVPDTIELLGRAGIKLWVLTGDKVETAINIGFSCNLLNNDMELITLKVDEDESGNTTDEVFLGRLEAELDKHLKTFGITGSDEDLAHAMKNHEPPAPTHALVIDGFTLRWVLHNSLKQKFLLLCKQCASVLCCRVSPAQKAAVVAMVKHGLDVMTLSIGDGANDVAMIQEADVGVGIAGVEGRQAVMSADYAIGQFRFLQRLVLVHGRWSYRRMAEAIANFFYKNMIWTLTILWFQCFCNFDITYLFEYTYIILFNLIFTSVPPIVIGVLDQDVSDAVSLAVPQLYRRGIERLEWTQHKFWLYMFDGAYQSVIGFFIPYLAFSPTSAVTGNGLDVGDRLRFGAYIAHPIVITINLYILINTYRWDWLTVLIIIISDVLVFFWTGVYTTSTFAGPFYHAAPQIYSEASFWAVLIATPIICLAPRYAIKALRKVYWPRDVDIIREQVTMGKFDQLLKEEPSDAAVKSTSSSSSQSSRVRRHQQFASVDEDLRPIYPPSVAEPSVAEPSVTGHNTRSQNGSDGTNYTRHDEPSTMDMPVQQPVDPPPEPPVRPSFDRVRPSYDRMRASMDRVRQSYEMSNEFTSAARLSRLESTHTSVSPPPEGTGIVNRIRRRTRGKSFKSAFAFHKDNHIHESE
ncbi:phospholipid-translocating P-type ATPase [Durotheca rogersii]|uniref:phospholipid-translocating P-type ATPase n=1 Tax=Durotheca rogersii TaxID=419775 RepID=UPI0022207A0D|nr:phospholipid-translocating P-type ATPase [Durotheca rogersii]KAI5867564.1 phospholipid-translocating P-type ATPase [Durotheca rogersii]